MQESGVTYRALADKTKLSAGYLNHLVHGQACPLGRHRRAWPKRSRSSPSTSASTGSARSARGNAGADRPALQAPRALIRRGAAARSLACSSASLFAALREALRLPESGCLLFELAADEFTRRFLARFARCMRLASFVFGVFHRHVDIVDAGNVAALAVSPVRNAGYVDNRAFTALFPTTNVSPACVDGWQKFRSLLKVLRGLGQRDRAEHADRGEAGSTTYPAIVAAGSGLDVPVEESHLHADVGMSATAHTPPPSRIRSGESAQMTEDRPSARHGPGATRSPRRLEARVRAVPSVPPGPARSEPLPQSP